jgi:hypothetical protein
MKGLQLTIIVGDRTVRAERSDDAQETGQIQLPPRIRRTIDVFADWLRHGKISRRAELEVLGSWLFTVLFDEKVQRFLMDAMRDSSQTDRITGGRLRVRLCFGADALGLRHWPWEFLYCPEEVNERGFFFATETDLILSRYHQRSQPLDAIAPGDRLRVLPVVAQPRGLPDIRESSFLRPLKRLQQRLPIEFEAVIRQKNIQELRDALQAERPDILHFIGYGRIHNDVPEIALAEGVQGAAWIPEKTFVEYLTEVRSELRLVFLHLCKPSYGSLPEDLIGSFVALAPRLLLTRVQAVVAMHYPISNEAAKVFLPKFYEELADGKPIDEAVFAARQNLVLSLKESYDDHTFGAPVLYMTRGDSLLRRSESQAPSAGSPTST